MLYVSKNTSVSICADHDNFPVLDNLKKYHGKLIKSQQKANF